MSDLDKERRRDDILFFLAVTIICGYVALLAVLFIFSVSGDYLTPAEVKVAEKVSEVVSIVSSNE